MKTLSILLLSLTYLFSQTTIDLGSKAQNNKAVSFKLLAKLMDEDEGFYDETKTTVAPNGTIFVFDFGNKIIHRYSKSGKHETSFGKEGNGPGELNQFTLSIKASNDRLLLGKGFQTVMLFDYDGKLIAEITKPSISRTLPVFIGDNIYFYSAPTALTKERLLVYTKDGNFVKEEKNEIYDESAMASLRGIPNDKTISKMLKMPNSLERYKDGFVVGYGGDYAFKFIDDNFKVKKKYSRSYSRVKIVDVMDIVPRFQKRFLKNMKTEQQRKMFMKITNSFSDQMGGYFPDIMRIIGVYKDHIFIRTSSEKKNQLRLDIISPNEKLLAIKNINSKDEYISSSVENGKLIINYSSEEDGPYAMLYDIALN